MSSSSESSSLDGILSELGKKFGKYQIKNYIFICIPIIYSALFALGYVFTTRNLDYRCYIPECDSLVSEPIYKPLWLPHAVPFQENDFPVRCQRFAAFSELNNTDPQCPKYLFNHNKTSETCDTFIFNSEDVSILKDFNLTCTANMWKLTIVGSINNVGQFVCMPLTGFISDRFGRRFALLTGLLITTILGTIKSFTQNYDTFLVFEFLCLAIGTGAGFSSAFVLGVEQVSPDKRVLAGTILSSAYAIGEALIGLIAMYTPNWRWFLRSIYLPGVLVIAFYWLTPESIRWMLNKGRGEEAKDVLRRAAKMNKINISEETLKELDIIQALVAEKTSSFQEEKEEKHSFWDIFKSKILLVRLINCSFCWITCVFVFYGLTLNSVTVTGNVYLNFIFVSLIEIPAYIVTYFIMDRYGRRFCLCGALILSGLACVTFIFIPSVSVWGKMSVFLVGKFGVTIAYTVLYVFTTELFPTAYRHSFLATCSMFGRIGSMIAPQTPLLDLVMKSLPLILFGGMSLMSGLLVLTFPETLNIKLPDTLEEAELIGRVNTKVDSKT